MSKVTRRGFIALASGLLVPEPERVRAYSFYSFATQFGPRDARVLLRSRLQRYVDLGVISGDFDTRFNDSGEMELVVTRLVATPSTKVGFFFSK